MSRLRCAVSQTPRCGGSGRQFEDILGEQGRERSVVVAAPADAPPMLRMQGASYATAIAEHFRDKGCHVLLLMDSLTRYAMARTSSPLACLRVLGTARCSWPRSSLTPWPEK